MLVRTSAVSPRSLCVMVFAARSFTRGCACLRDGAATAAAAPDVIEVAAAVDGVMSFPRTGGEIDLVTQSSTRADAPAAATSFGSRRSNRRSCRASEGGSSSICCRILYARLVVWMGGVARCKMTKRCVCNAIGETCERARVSVFPTIGKCIALNEQGGVCVGREQEEV